MKLLKALTSYIIHMDYLSINGAIAHKGDIRVIVLHSLIAPHLPVK